LFKKELIDGGMKKEKIYKLPEDVINPHPRAYPRYLISPFNTEHLTINHEIYLRDRKLNIKAGFLEKYFNDSKKYSYITKRGQEAIAIILKDLFLNPSDDICILNTSGSPYISSCITSEIEKVCKWGRSVGAKTKGIFIIHEFGFPARVPNEILNLNIPIIEDCAYCLGSQNEDNTIGKLGDYTIYSFSKIFPVQYGGLIRSKKKLNGESAISKYSRDYLLTLLHYYFKGHKKEMKLRKENYGKFVKLFALHGITPRFNMEKNNTPACFVFHLPQSPLSDKLKIELNNKGIESTVYYRGNGFFVPCHQYLTDRDIEYIYANICQVLGLSL
jgi:hypothetical protein